MERLTFAEFRALPQESRSKVMTVGLSHYLVRDYVGPIVASGLTAIEQLTSGLSMQDYDEDDRDAEILAYRALDAARISAIRQLVPAAHGEAKKDYAKIGSLKIDWPVQHKALQTWSGQQTYTGLLNKRLDAMDGWQRDCDALDYERGLTGVSGIMPGHAKINALDMGFSPDGMAIVTQPWREVVMLIGIRFAPILIRDDVYSVWWHGDWHSWQVIERVPPYLWAWTPIGTRPLES